MSVVKIADAVAAKTRADFADRPLRDVKRLLRDATTLLPGMADTEDERVGIKLGLQRVGRERCRAYFAALNDGELQTCAVLAREFYVSGEQQRPDLDWAQSVRLDALEAEILARWPEIDEAIDAYFEEHENPEDGPQPWKRFASWPEFLFSLKGGTE